MADLKGTVFEEVTIIFFHIIAIIAIFIVFRKDKVVLAEESVKDAKREWIFSFIWFWCYFVLAMINHALKLDMVNEVTNWLLFVLIPLLAVAHIRKENWKEALKSIGIKRFNKKTGIKILLVCIVYICVIFLIFSLGEETQDIFANMPKIMAGIPLFMGLMILTAGFTEEFFFRGILQRSLINIWKRPYIAILVTGIFFALYHFPFAYYLWEESAGSVVNSFKTIIEHVAAGFMLGLIYYRSNKNLWSSVIMHALTNAVIMAIGVVIG